MGWEESGLIDFAASPSLSVPAFFALLTPLAFTRLQWITGHTVTYDYTLTGAAYGAGFGLSLAAFVILLVAGIVHLVVYRSSSSSTDERVRCCRARAGLCRAIVVWGTLVRHGHASRGVCLCLCVLVCACVQQGYLFKA